MSFALIDRLSQAYGYPLLDADSIDPFLRANPGATCVLFCAEDPKSFPESNDVAVILPELVGVFAGRLKPAVVARSYERELYRRYGFTAWPTLLFLRGGDGDYLDAISRVQNWDDYIEKISAILTAEPRRPPSVGIPVKQAASSGAACRP